MAVPIFTPGEPDPLFGAAVKEVCRFDRASSSLLQRRLQIGYARAARLVDDLEMAGVLGPSDGASHARVVLIKSSSEFLKEVEKGLKLVSKEEIVNTETYPHYKIPKTSLIKKPMENPWKKSLFQAVNDPAFKKADGLSFPLGFTDKGELLIKNLSEIQHLAIGGNALSQKEVMLDTILTSLLLKEKPTNLKLILVDSRRYLNYYQNLPHLLTPVINDSDKTVSALEWLKYEQDRRLKLFAESQKRDLLGYKKLFPWKLPHILLVINNISDSLLYSPVQTEDCLTQVLRLAPRTGIHVVFTANLLATSSVSNLIQSEIPSKLFFRYISYIDAGPQKVKEVESLGKGETIFVSEEGLQKLDAIYTSEEDVKAVVKAATASNS